MVDVVDVTGWTAMDVELLCIKKSKNARGNIVYHFVQTLFV